MNIYLDRTKDCVHLEYFKDEKRDHLSNLDDFDQNYIDRMIPYDKSITHRALFLSFLIDKGAKIVNPLISLDTISTMKVIEALGADINFILDDKLIKFPIEDDLIEKLSNYKQIYLDIKPNRYIKNGNDNQDQPIYLDCGSSGTSARLSMGVVCNCCDIANHKSYCIDGSSSLRLRPMKRGVDILLEMGVHVEKKDHLPILIEKNNFNGIRLKDHILSIPSAQLKSMIILSYLNSVGRYSIRLPSGSRTHTEEMIKDLFAKNSAGSVSTSYEYNKNNDTTLEYIDIHQTKKISGFDKAIFVIPKDPSSIIFFVILFFILNRSIVFKDVSNSKGRLDYIDILNTIGFNIKIEDKTQLVTDISIVKDDGIGVGMEDRLDKLKRLRPFNISKYQIPSIIDEIPSLIILSGFIEGDSYFYGIEELRIKESDRLERSINFLRMFGIESRINIDSKGSTNLIVYGKAYQNIDINKKVGIDSNKDNNVLIYDSYQDHRMVMIATVISIILHKNMIIKNIGCVKESFPSFFKIIKNMFE